MLSPKLSNPTELDDTTLVEQVRTGDRRAFSELVRRHQPAVYRSCYRILGHDEEDAKDASQETFLRAYRKIDTFRGRSTFKTWLVRVAINVSLNERSSRGRKVPHSDIDLAQFVASIEEGPEVALTRAEAVIRMHGALRLVRPDHRAAIVLRELEGLTYQETAESLGVAQGTAKSWVHRGRDQLKKILIAA